MKYPAPTFRAKMTPGFALPVVLITFVALITMAVVIAQMVVANYNVARGDVARLQAQMATDSGLDAAIAAINEDNGWTTTAGEVELYNNGDERSTYEVFVIEGAGTDRVTLEGVGRTYRPANSTTPTKERRYEITMRGIPEQTGGNYSVVTGVGGLYMYNNSKIVGGDVFVNGEVEMTNNAQIGLSTTPVNTQVAHQNCPVGGGSSYPRVCGAGENDQPITQHNNAHIYGEVRATNQTDGSQMSNPGLVSGTPTPTELPTHDRATQIANVATTSSSSSFLNCWGSNTVMWPARLKIVGSVNISGKCKVYVSGDVWITGSLNVSNNSEIIVLDSIALGGQNTVNANLPTVMVDDTINISNNGEVISNVNKIGVQFITFKSNASCSPNCADVTGQDLYNSRNNQTINISNNAEAPESVFYARWTQVQMSNGGAIGAIAGQTVRLSNGATITFGAAVGGGGSGVTTYTYVVEDYRRIF